MAEAAANPTGIRITEQVEVLAEKLFSNALGPDGVVLGVGNDDIVAKSVHELVTDPSNTLATYVKDGGLIDFSLAIPIGKMDPARASESNETAYIYFTGIQPEFQGQGHVRSVITDMYHKLRDRGFGFVERDSVLAQRYADKVEKANQGAIVEKYDHDPWGLGVERHFRIDLAKWFALH